MVSATSPTYTHLNHTLPRTILPASGAVAATLALKVPWPRQRCSLAQRPQRLRQEDKHHFCLTINYWNHWSLPAKKIQSFFFSLHFFLVQNSPLDEFWEVPRTNHKPKKDENGQPFDPTPRKVTRNASLPCWPAARDQHQGTLAKKLSQRYWPRRESSLSYASCLWKVFSRSLANLILPPCNCPRIEC